MPMLSVYPFGEPKTEDGTDNPRNVIVQYPGFKQLFVAPLTTGPPVPPPVFNVLHVVLQPCDQVEIRAACGVTDEVADEGI